MDCRKVTNEQLMEELKKQTVILKDIEKILSIWNDDGTPDSAIEITSKETGEGVILEVTIPNIESYRLHDIIINGKSVWLKNVGISDFNLNIAGDKIYPVMTIKGQAKTRN